MPALQKRWYRPSKSASIGYIHIFIKAVLVFLKTPEQGLKAPGPILALLKSAGTCPHDPSPHLKSGGLKRREKKRQDRNFDPIPTLFGAIPALFKTLG